VGHAGQALLAAAAAHHQMRGRRRELQRRARGAAADRPELRLASGQTCLPKRPRQRHHPQVALYAKVRNLLRNSHSKMPIAQIVILNISTDNVTQNSTLWAANFFGNLLIPHFKPPLYVKNKKKD